MWFTDGTKERENLLYESCDTAGLASTEQIDQQHPATETFVIHPGRGWRNQDL